MPLGLKVLRAVQEFAGFLLAGGSADHDEEKCGDKEDASRSVPFTNVPLRTPAQG
jgi:hypothetical protein